MELQVKPAGSASAALYDTNCIVVELGLRVDLQGCDKICILVCEYILARHVKMHPSLAKQKVWLD